MTKKFEIRNSTAEFLIFMAEGKEDGVRVDSRRVTQFRQWCTFVLRQYAIRGLCA